MQGAKDSEVEGNSSEASSRQSEADLVVPILRRWQRSGRWVVGNLVGVVARVDIGADGLIVGGAPDNEEQVPGHWSAGVAEYLIHARVVGDARYWIGTWVRVPHADRPACVAGSVPNGCSGVGDSFGSADEADGRHNAARWRADHVSALARLMPPEDTCAATTKWMIEAMSSVIMAIAIPKMKILAVGGIFSVRTSELTSS